MSLYKYQDNSLILIAGNSNNVVSKSYNYILKVTQTINSDVDITLPCNYKVGSGCMSIFLNGEKLIASTQSFEGGYKEVGQVGSISNKIQLDGTSGAWSVESGDVFEIIVNGNYE